MQNQRKMYGETLVSLGRERSDIVALEADLGKSTMSILFQNEFPERFFEMGIGEQNMAAFAAGLALTGKTPFINSFAVFTTGRCFDQLRQSICTANLNVKIGGSSAGLSDFGDGATHQSVEDIAIMRARACGWVRSGKGGKAGGGHRRPGVYTHFPHGDACGNGRGFTV